MIIMIVILLMLSPRGRRDVRQRGVHERRPGLGAQGVNHYGHFNELHYYI